MCMHKNMIVKATWLVPFTGRLSHMEEGMKLLPPCFEATYMQVTCLLGYLLQDELPCITEEGKIILESRQKAARAPNGNGGLFLALMK